MGNLINFKMPKIDKSILPSSSDFGITNDTINTKINELKDKLNVDGINLPELGNMKGNAKELIKSIPKVSGFSALSLVPDSLLDKMDPKKATDEINKKLAEVDLGGVATLQLPNDVGTMAKDIISGKGVDFSSLYTMPPTSVFEAPKVGSDFNTDEFMAEINAFESAVNNDFDIDKFVNDFSNIDI